MHCGWSSPQIPTSILCVDLLTNQIGWKAGLCKGQTNYCNRIPRTHTTDIFINRKDKLKKKDNKCLPSWNTSNKCEEEKENTGKYDRSLNRLRGQGERWEERWRTSWGESVAQCTEGNGDRWQVGLVVIDWCSGQKEIKAEPWGPP